MSISRPEFSASPDLEAKDAEMLESEHKSLSDENADFLGLEIEINHVVDDEEYGQLPREIKDLCSGLPTYNVNYVKTDLSMDSFLHEQLLDENQPERNHFSLSRSKRQAGDFSICRADQSLVWHYIS